MFIPSDCWWFVPSLSGLPLVPVPLALWSAVPSFVLHFAWPFGAAGAATAPLSGSPVLFVRVSFVWGWLRFWASVGPFASLVCLRGLLLLLLPRLPFTCALPTWGQLTSPQSSTPTVAAYVDIPLCWGGSLHHHGCKKCNVSHGRVLSRRHPRGQSFGRL